jgi:hypothetical protein
LDIITISFVYKKRDAVSQRLSVLRTVTKGQKGTFILTSGGPEKKKIKMTMNKKHLHTTLIPCITTLGFGVWR